MPAILAAADYDRWLGTEPDPRDPTPTLPVGPDGDLAYLDARQFPGE